MPEKRVSEYLNQSVTDLKSKLREKSISTKGNKEALVGRVMDYEEAYENVTLVRDVTYKPTKKDVKYGIVTNLPLNFQTKVLRAFADHLEELYDCHNPIYDRTTSARDSFIRILRHAMWCEKSTCGESAFYLGITNKTNNGQVGKKSNGHPDKNGKVFVEVLADTAAEIWIDTLGTTWVDDYTTHYFVFRDPIHKIVNKLRNMLKNKREEVDELEKKQQEAMSVFLNGCLNQNSGSPFLPLIAPLYSYEPFRKEIEGYVGVTTQ